MGFTAALAVNMDRPKDFASTVRSLCSCDTALHLRLGRVRYGRTSRVKTFLRAHTLCTSPALKVKLYDYASVRAFVPRNPRMPGVKECSDTSSCNRGRWGSTAGTDAGTPATSGCLEDAACLLYDDSVATSEFTDGDSLVDAATLEAREALFEQWSTSTLVRLGICSKTLQCGFRWPS